MSLLTRLLAAGAAGLALTGALTAPASASSSVAASSSYARTSAAERHRVDSVKTPKLHWYACYDWGQCATAKVPLDYDHPTGKQVTLALLRVRARDQKHRIGSLFVNPGGPGGSATSMALGAPYFLSQSILDRFDIVGMDPRGVGFSQQVDCFPSAARQTPTLNSLSIGFPWGAKEEKSFITAAQNEARGCSTTGRELAGAMSTAEVARDMDVMRRAVGDKQLSYLGFSYGTALGQYYANMFPDRFRALVVDGVIDPAAWVGSKATAGQIQDDRLHSADGAWKALAEILRRCAAAGPAKCVFSDAPMRNFRVVAERLKAKPVTLDGDQVTYAGFIGLVLSALYETDAGAEVTDLAAKLYDLTTPGAKPSTTQVAAAKATLTRMRSRSAGRAFPYDNSFDAYSAVMCTDGVHPAHGSTWPNATARADKRAPYLGRAWAWASVQCARDHWTAHDEDAYTGPFNKMTEHPVLVVGSMWDPATNYEDAVRSSHLLPNSRLLSNTNWGHTAYGTSACATTWTDRYLLFRALPPKGTTCIGDAQPFTQDLTTTATSTATAATSQFNLRTATPAEIAAHGLPPAGAPKVLPPVIG